MVLDDVLASLFPAGHDIDVDAGGLLTGRGAAAFGAIDVIGVTQRAALGVHGALKLAAHVLATIARGGATPILVLVDGDSQRMSRRDELLGMNEYLAHLAKCLQRADALGHRTIGLLYGHAAAGAFIATALATRTLVALPDAQPEVMDLQAMARVTKLPLDVLSDKARSTAVFAPGLDNFAKTGAIDEVLDPSRSLAEQLAELIARPVDRTDRRGRLGRERGGRPVAADVAQRVYELARAGG
ncbi:biotin-independent malonate decarboxylase subunit gamma [Burkholderia sp. TSV86]|uniref:biotin-independent malonate decarboxylase subunit gamma n=1 Tax=Burkholderia sp. TSV86 TaxID=1385594 RepID=UPI0007585202|nr:biotin-independent malonate decarboxylase subunit gamma [Burkholderia sp. TSV86]KVE36599.1 biotin-independent malonate decarboxylase subunit gamma [Burkholderia sp. TSV86]